MFQELNNKIEQLTSEDDQRKSLDLAIETANELLRVLDPNASNLRTGEDALDDAIPVNQFPNQKVENWFMNHPYFTGDKVALRFYSSKNVETKFYWLSDSATKARVSAGVMLTPNWEDSELTRNESYKVGIDFFLTANAKSLLVVLSDNGKLRLLEFSERLSHTQIEILQKLRGALSLTTKEQVHKTLWDALALSEVNKKFYAGVAEQFNILLNHLIADGKDKEDSKLFASRLLGRLLFIWFLRRKNIIQEQYGYFDLEGNNSTEYYEKKLKKLFFATLNKPIDERNSEDRETPYLNGGLFEAHDNDWPTQTIDFPPGYFNGLYGHLEKYNFTTDESSPEYEQVAIDPEMLGRVFESLLATQVTETGEQARKAKGAFYTPREIVSYMCRESLRQFLYAKLGNDTWNEGIDKLLDASDSEWEIGHSNSKRNLWGESNLNTVPRLVVAALDDLRVFDPACGSGAFPMGMLQLILKTYERLDPRFDPYKTKLQIIQNNIFGVDIEPMAVEISRLRAWLSLIVDEKEGRRAEPLPNLDFKFISANSLIPLEQQTSMFTDANLHEKLMEVREKFFNARKPEMKEKWKREYYKLTGHGQAILGGDRRDQQLKSFDPFKNSQHADFFDPDYMFGVSSFNIVIGNPPYVQIKKLPYKTRLKQLTFKTFNSSGDLYALFYEKANELLSLDYGIGAYITSNKWMRTNYGESLRDYFIRKTKNKRLIDFNAFKVFETATVDTNILLWSHSESSDQSLVASLIGADFTQKDDLAEYTRGSEIFINCQGSKPWLILSKEQTTLHEKVQRHHQTLINFDVSLHYGMLTGANKTFILDEKHKQQLEDLDPKNAEVIKPILRGEDVRRYGYEFKNFYLLCLHNGIKKKGLPPINVQRDYPTILGYLETFGDEFKKRGEQGDNWWNLRNCAYLDKFEQAKIIYSDIVQDTGRFYLDIDGFYTNDTAFIISGKNLELLTGVLNSKAFSYFYKFFYSGGILGSSGVRYKRDFLLSVPLPDFTQDQKYEIERIVNEIRTLKLEKNHSNTLELENHIDAIIYESYGLNKNEIDLIENHFN